MNANEIWVDVVDSGGKYQVSSFGNLKRQNGVLFNKYMAPNGYYIVTLYINSRKIHTPIHRLVAQAFIPNPENKKTVNHKDSDRLNNYVNNLEWATNSENQKHSYRNGRRPKTALQKIQESTALYPRKRTVLLNLITGEKVECESVSDAARLVGLKFDKVIRAIARNHVLVNCFLAEYLPS